LRCLSRAPSLLSMISHFGPIIHITRDLTTGWAFCAKNYKFTQKAPNWTDSGNIQLPLRVARDTVRYVRDTSAVNSIYQLFSRFSFRAMNKEWTACRAWVTPLAVHFHSQDISTKQLNIKFFTDSLAQICSPHIHLLDIRNLNNENQTERSLQISSCWNWLRLLSSLELNTSDGSKSTLYISSETPRVIKLDMQTVQTGCTFALFYRSSLVVDDCFGIAFNTRSKSLMNRLKERIALSAARTSASIYWSLNKREMTSDDIISAIRKQIENIQTPKGFSHCEQKCLLQALYAWVSQYWCLVLMPPIHLFEWKKPL